MDFVERCLTAKHFGDAALIKTCHASLARKSLQVPFVPAPFDLAAKVRIDQEKLADGCAPLKAGLRAFTTPDRLEHAPSVARRARVAEKSDHAFSDLGIDGRVLGAART